MYARFLFATALLVGLTGHAYAQSLKAEPDYPRDEDVIYGRRDGHALTMDVIRPKDQVKANGAGVILCVSGGFQSSKDMLQWVHPLATSHLLDRGYVVFAVVHSSAPRYTVPEIVEDMHRAVRFVKSRATKYGVDPAKIGITGASSGGHLSLMMGFDGRPGPSGARDPVERESSKVAAVACFFPPTDFVQFDRDELRNEQRPFRTLFDVRRPDPVTNKLERVSDAERREIGRLCSPLYCAKDKRDAAPTYIIHGRLDDLVPVHHSEMLHDLMRECGAVCKLDVMPKMRHSALDAAPHLPRLADWFDLQLLGKKK